MTADAKTTADRLAEAVRQFEKTRDFGDQIEMFNALAAYDARKLDARLDLYSELADAMGSDPMDSHDGRVTLARKMRAMYDARKRVTVEEVARVAYIAYAGLIPDAELDRDDRDEWIKAARAAMRAMGEEP